MEIREYTGFNEAEITRLYSEVGWTAYTKDIKSLKRGFENSLLILASYERGELIGLIRAVGDGFTVLLIQDILVLPEKQRKGVGTALMKAMLEKYPDVRQIMLITDNTQKTAAFYRSLGFSELSEFGCLGFMKQR